MPHLRKRHLESLFEKTLSFSPLVGIFGHRQVGKTTLSSSLGKHYVTLDDPSTLQLIASDPQGFLENQKAKTVIDECQLLPELFPALKEHVRKHPKPGQFILTGSVRFTSRKAIRESLTGRLISWELLPMDISETNENPLPQYLNKLISAQTVDIEMKTKTRLSSKDLSLYLSKGGLPGVFPVRNDRLLQQKFETQLESILERDLRLINQTTLTYRQILSALEYLAQIQGEPLEWSDFSRSVQISVPSLKKLVGNFESLFLIRILKTFGSEKKPVIFFEDQGEASFLLTKALSPQKDLIRFLFAQLHAQTNYQEQNKLHLTQFRNRGGSLIPLCVQSKAGTVGFLPSLTENPNPGLIKTASAFVQQVPDSKVLIFHTGKLDQTISKNIRVVSLDQLI